MKQKYVVLLVAIHALSRGGGEVVTVGDVARFLNMSKSTVRNRVVWLFGKGLACCEKHAYKSTGKYALKLTTDGNAWVLDQKVMWE